MRWTHSCSPQRCTCRRYYAAPDVCQGRYATVPQTVPKKNFFSTLLVYTCIAASYRNAHSFHRDTGVQCARGASVDFSGFLYEESHHGNRKLNFNVNVFVIFTRTHFVLLSRIPSVLTVRKNVTCGSSTTRTRAASSVACGGTPLPGVARLSPMVIS